MNTYDNRVDMGQPFMFPKAVDLAFLANDVEASINIGIIAQKQSA